MTAFPTVELAVDAQKHQINGTQVSTYTVTWTYTAVTVQ